MFSRTSLTAVLGVLLGFNALAVAQQPQGAPPSGEMPHERMRHRDGRGQGKLGGPGELGLMRELNLTEDQRQQQRAIVKRHLESIKAQREELFRLREKRMDGTFSAEDETRAKALRQEIHNVMQGMGNDIDATLTSEQRTKLEQIKSERKARHDEMFRRREERRPNIIQ